MQMSFFPDWQIKSLCCVQYTICKSMSYSSAAMKEVHLNRNWKLVGVVKNVFDKKIMP